MHVVQRGAGATAPYSDVPLSHPYSDHIALIKLHAISLGCGGDASVRPQA